MHEAAWTINDHVSQLDRGYVHVYTGDGKGKTTAAMGLAMRAAGSGLRVAVAAFMNHFHEGLCLLNDRHPEWLSRSRVYGHQGYP